MALGGVEGCKVGMLGVDLTELKLLLVEVADAKVFLGQEWPLKWGCVNYQLEVP